MTSFLFDSQSHRNRETFCARSEHDFVPLLAFLFPHYFVVLVMLKSSQIVNDSFLFNAVIIIEFGMLQLLSQDQDTEFKS